MNPRKRLKRYRKEHNLSVAQLAMLVSCSTQFIYALEDGTLGKVPGLLLGARIESITGIANDDWNRVATVNHQRPRLKSA